jgi:hypothetical protein
MEIWRSPNSCTPRRPASLSLYAVYVQKTCYSSLVQTENDIFCQKTVGKVCFNTYTCYCLSLYVHVSNGKKTFTIQSQQRFSPNKPVFYLFTFTNGWERKNEKVKKKQALNKFKNFDLIVHIYRSIYIYLSVQNSQSSQLCTSSREIDFRQSEND